MRACSAICIGSFRHIVQAAHQKTRYYVKAGNLTDRDASWASPSENVYTFTEKDAAELTFNYTPSQDLLHRSFQDGERKLDFVYARAFVGTWKLDKVMEIHEGDAPAELSKDGNQSLYAESENLLTIKPDGTALCKEKSGGETTDVKGTWKKADVDKIIWTEKDLDTVLRYFSVDDTLFRDVVNEAADAGHKHLRFVYARQADLAEKEESKEGGKEGGGGDHWYGDDGSVWVFEGYFEWLDEQNAKAAEEQVVEPEEPVEVVEEVVEEVYEPAVEEVYVDEADGE